jgi:RNA polymerase sigma-70 factor, ECF subfamily
MVFELEQVAEFIDRYSHAQCFSSTEAEDLAQEIMLQAWLCRERIGQAENTNAYLAGICRNTYRNWLRRKKHEPKTTHLWMSADDSDCIDMLPQTMEDGDEEEIRRLRRLVSNLAGQYRKLVIGFYYEDKSIRDLSRELSVPKGTIKWRLMIAKQNIKKEWALMEPIMRIKPVQLRIDLSGSAPQYSPVPQMTTAVRSSLLWALQKPMGIKEAADQLAIPTMYVEEEIKGLMELEAICKLPSDKYGTDFIIQSVDYQKTVTELAKQYAPAARRSLLEKFDQLKEQLLNTGFETGGTPWEELRYSLLLHLVHDSGVLWENIADFTPPMRADGGRYYFLCREYDKKPDLYGVHDWYGGIPGVQYRTCSMGDTSILDRLGVSMVEITTWCRQIHDTNSLDGADKEIIARLLAAGLIEKSGDMLKLAVPWISPDQVKKLQLLAKELAQVLHPGLDDFRNQAVSVLQQGLSDHLRKYLPIQKVWVGFDLLKEIMRPIWPEDARSVAGLFFAETSV